MKNNAIGIIDSGIGGFTVAKQIQALLPHEDILYLGDGGNAPYGNRPPEEIVTLTRYMVDFMNQNEVKLLLVACNTICCLSEQYESGVNSPILYVVNSGAVGASKLPDTHIGVISTNFTHQSGTYSKLVQELDPSKKVSSNGSVDLAALIEANDGGEDSLSRLQTSIKTAIDPLKAQGITTCILGCTHYPLVSNIVGDIYPDLTLLDPAQEMAKEAQALLEAQGIAGDKNKQGTMTVFTTGEINGHDIHIKRANLQHIKEICQTKKLELTKVVF